MRGGLLRVEGWWTSRAQRLVCGTHEWLLLLLIPRSIWKLSIRNRSCVLLRRSTPGNARIQARGWSSLSLLSLLRYSNTRVRGNHVGLTRQGSLCRRNGCLLTGSHSHMCPTAIRARLFRDGIDIDGFWTVLKLARSRWLSGCGGSLSHSRRRWLLTHLRIGPRLRSHLLIAHSRLSAHLRIGRSGLRTHRLLLLTHLWIAHYRLRTHSLLVSLRIHARLLRIRHPCLLARLTHVRIGHSSLRGHWLVTHHRLLACLRLPRRLGCHHSGSGGSRGRMLSQTHLLTLLHMLPSAIQARIASSIPVDWSTTSGNEAVLTSRRLLRLAA